MLSDPTDDTLSTNRPSKQERVLKNYCDNLNERAATGDIDPIVGREEQLEHFILVFALEVY